MQVPYKEDELRALALQAIPKISVATMEEVLSYFSVLLSIASIVFSTCASDLTMPSLGVMRRTDRKEAAKVMSSKSHEHLKTFYYTQTLDHFNYQPESYITFKQRYIIDFSFWDDDDANSSSPIFAFFGAEESLDEDIGSVGFHRDIAPEFNALVVYIEHRYYGKSIPFGSSKEALANASTLGYCNSAQALADYAAVLLHIKKTYSAKNSPIIVIGGSYGGMLAAWFRLKYPHIALGALASSAPVLYVTGGAPKHGYYYVVTKDFKETSESCYEAIRQSWKQIDKISSTPNGLSILSSRFRTCDGLNSSSELKDFLDSMYCEAAQYNHPPDDSVSLICGSIDKAANKTDILGQIFSGVIAYYGNKSCIDTDDFSYPIEDIKAWRWQTCSEMVMPIGHDVGDSMFPPAPFNLSDHIDACKRTFGITPRPNWLATYYGGQDLKLVLHRFASNIIFSNGLRDPYSSGGVLANISDSVVAVSTVLGSHCLDIQSATAKDPDWLVIQRKTEVEIIKGWIVQYQAHTRA